MKELLESDYIVGHNISSRGVTVVPVITDSVDFDLKDNFPIEILPLGMGQLSTHNEKGNLEIIHYENFVNQCKRPASFLRGRSKCDLILTCIDNRETALLIEMTSERLYVRPTGQLHFQEESLKSANFNCIAALGI